MFSKLTSTAAAVASTAAAAAGEAGNYVTDGAKKGAKAVIAAAGGQDAAHGKDESMFTDKLSNVGEPKPFKKSEQCNKCGGKFGLTLYRHHCRACGESFCGAHACIEDFVPEYGFASTQRVCQACHERLQYEAYQRRLKWRLERVQSFLQGTLKPLTEADEMTNSALFLHGAVAVSRVATHVPGLGVVADTIVLLNDFGKHAFAGVMLQSEFAECIQAVQAMMGDVDQMSMRDVAGSLYYLMTDRRAERGNRPTAEREMHAQSYKLEDRTLHDISRYAAFALVFAYISDELDIQRLVAQHGFVLVFAETVSGKEMPAFFLCCNPRTKEAIVAVRGTASVHDVLTDIKATALPFASGLEFPGRETHARVADPPTAGHSGMARTALWMQSELLQSLLTLKSAGYSFTLTGHSLGAGAASMLAILLQPILQNLRCFGFATPACVDAALSNQAKPFITTIVLHDDVVPRATVPATKKLLKEIHQNYRNTWQARFEQDKQAAKMKAKRAFTHSRTAAKVAQEQLALDAQERARQAELAREQQAKAALAQEPENLSLALDQQANAERLAAEKKSIEKIVVPDLFTPGVVVHLYFHHGRYEAAVTDAFHPTLTRLEIYPNMADDHLGASYFEAVGHLIMSRKTTNVPTPWAPFSSAKVCSICQAPFSWASTSQSESQENMDKWNCHCCGRVVCLPCSSNSRPLPGLGIFKAVQVCDPCFYNLGLY
eukprot:TRINITY_DN1329_c0_g1_i2.p1 TRINITY_DN1329_c0_g1~~TRINITY_DN1329_c0_g1_i2.p1  ORF type:complete len:727 (+),score=170.72 TRINITY_DN1329_c0_g1_i2:28-2181(+)